MHWEKEVGELQAKVPGVHGPERGGADEAEDAEAEGRGEARLDGEAAMVVVVVSVEQEDVVWRGKSIVFAVEAALAEVVSVLKASSVVGGEKAVLVHVVVVVMEEDTLEQLPPGILRTVIPGMSRSQSWPGFVLLRSSKLMPSLLAIP